MFECKQRSTRVQNIVSFDWLIRSVHAPAHGAGIFSQSAPCIINRSSCITIITMFILNKGITLNIETCFWLVKTPWFRCLAQNRLTHVYFITLLQSYYHFQGAVNESRRSVPQTCQSRPVSCNLHLYNLSSGCNFM